MNTELERCEDAYSELDDQLQEFHHILKADPLEDPVEAAKRVMDDLDKMRVVLEDALSYFEAQWDLMGGHPASQYASYVKNIRDVLGKDTEPPADRAPGARGGEG